MPLTFSLSPALLDRFPDCRAGGFLVHGLRAAAARLAEEPEPLSAAALETAGITQQNLADEPRIQAWRRAIARCGLKPSTYKSSPEQLAARLLRGKGISTPLPVVNAYCAISIRHLAPMGGYDLRRLPEPAITLRLARPGEDVFQPLGGRAEDMPLTENVAVYASGSEVICWAFNHRDSARTCLEAETDEAVFFSEAVAPEQHAGLEAGLRELADFIRADGGGGWGGSDCGVGGGGGAFSRPVIAETWMVTALAQRKQVALNFVHGHAVRSRHPRRPLPAGSADRAGRREVSERLCCPPLSTSDRGGQVAPRALPSLDKTATPPAAASGRCTRCDRGVEKDPPA